MVVVFFAILFLASVGTLIHLGPFYMSLDSKTPAREGWCLGSKVIEYLLG